MLPTTENDALLRTPEISPECIAEYLEDELGQNNLKHCTTCTCTIKSLHKGFQRICDAKTQTEVTSSSYFLRSSSPIRDPRLITCFPKDSILLKTGEKEEKGSCESKYDLLVNPILGHHRLCEQNRHNDITYLIEASERGLDFEKEIQTYHKENVKCKYVCKTSEAASEGAKIFQNYSRNLIHSMKVKTEVV